MIVFHWHGETFNIAPNAKRIASSSAYENQGFAYRDQMLALQFHLEVTPEIVEGLIRHCGHELNGSPSVQDAGEIFGGIHHCTRNRDVLFHILDNWLIKK
jgi:hypothetical protein